MLYRIVGYKENRKYFWPVNIPMDASHFRGNIKIFTQPLDRIGFCLLKMSGELNLSEGGLRLNHCGYPVFSEYTLYFLRKCMSGHMGQSPLLLIFLVFYLSWAYLF